MENPKNKPREQDTPWKEICGIPKGWHTIPIWGFGARSKYPGVADDLIAKGIMPPIGSLDIVRQKVCYGVLQIHVDSTGLVTHRKSISFSKPFIREDFPELTQMASEDWDKLHAEIQRLKGEDGKEK